MDDAALVHLSRSGQLSLSLAEMQAIQAPLPRARPRPDRLRARDAGPDLERALLAQDAAGAGSSSRARSSTTCSSRRSSRRRSDLDRDWCVSVFADNAGVVRFDDEYDVCFKVETHNHPSAIEPYGGANTGLGGVIRDALGTGLGAKPICNTDVFCVAPPDLAARQRCRRACCTRKRVLKGVVAGVRDYGNRMGIPTVNGALVVDPRLPGQPARLLRHGRRDPARAWRASSVEPGDRIVAVGGRTGRDGIHGATFSSAELTGESETVSGGAVQIGNAITEKKVLDVDPPGARPRPLPRDHRLRRRRLQLGRRRDGRDARRRGRPRPRAAQVRGALVHRDLDLRGAGADGPGRAARATGPSCRSSATREDVEATDLGRFVDRAG